MTSLSVAVIGAGAAGLAAARALSRHFSVRVFEKARGPGGRLAHRRREHFAFDFGAQYFTARDPRFVAEVAALRSAGIVSPWHCRFSKMENGREIDRQIWDDDTAHYVGTGRMSALSAYWASGMDVKLQTRITQLRETRTVWSLQSDSGEVFGPFAFVVIALPALQAAALLPDQSPLRVNAQEARMSGCFALMLGLEAPAELTFDAAEIINGPLSWLAVCDSRPGHEAGPGLVVLSNNLWADVHMEDPPSLVEAVMRAELDRLIAAKLRVVHADLHRWRYANCPPIHDALPMLDARNRLALCGDWTDHGRVEAAYLSGVRIAELVRGVLTA